MMPFDQSLKQARQYGLGEYLEIMGELSQESTKKGALSRKSKELLTLGIAMHKQCHRCIDIHQQEAARLEVTDAEFAQLRKIVLYLTLRPGNQGQLQETLDKAWTEFSLSKGALSRPLRELLALGIALVKQNEADIHRHVGAAIKYGATPEEVYEVLPIALLMDGAPALSQMPVLMEAVQQVQGDNASVPA